MGKLLASTQLLGSRFQVLASTKLLASSFYIAKRSKTIDEKLQKFREDSNWEIDGFVDYTISDSKDIEWNESVPGSPNAVCDVGCTQDVHRMYIGCRHLRYKI